MSGSDPLVTVILVTHNSRPVLGDCLDHLIQAMRPIPSELIVVDNASSDGSASEVRRRVSTAYVMTNPSNLGYAAACNQAAAAASGEYLFFLNPDVQVDADAITALWKVVSQTQRAGLASGRLRLPDGSFHPTCRETPTVRNVFSSRGSILSRLPFVKQSIKRYTLPDYDEVTMVASPSATMATIRRDLFHRIGGFDERFFMFLEDTDLAFRLLEAGYVNLFVPQAGGVHRWGRGGRQSKFQRAWRHHRSFWQYVHKHFGRAKAILVTPLLLCNLVAVSLLPDRRPKG